MFVDEVLSALDVLLEFWDGLGQEFLLEGVQLAESEVLFDSVLAQDEWSREILGFGDVGADVGALDDVLFSVHGTDEGDGEAGSGIGHREGGGSSAGLGLDDFSSGFLDALGEGLDLVSWEVDGGLALREQWHDGDSGVSSDDWDVDLLWVDSEGLADEGVGADDVQSRNTEDALWVQNAGLSKSLAGNGDSRVDWVRDDSDEGFGASLGATGGQVADDRGVGVEEIVASHSWLAWNASWDDDNIGI